jgi:hypothetical protein
MCVGDKQGWGFMSMTLRNAIIVLATANVLSIGSARAGSQENGASVEIAGGTSLAWMYTSGFFEAPTGGQRDWYGKWISYVREFDVKTLQSGKSKIALGLADAVPTGNEHCRDRTTVRRRKSNREIRVVYIGRQSAHRL